MAQDSGSGLRNAAVLTTEGDYTLLHGTDDNDEQVTCLVWPGGSVEIWDDPIEPTCAIISVEGGWCMIGGVGLLVAQFEGGLPTGTEPLDPRRITRRRLWAGVFRGMASQGENLELQRDRIWRIEMARYYEGDLVRVVTDLCSDYAGVYEVDVRTLDGRRI